MNDRELLLERLGRLAIVLDELMPRCAGLVRDAIALLKQQEAVEPALEQDSMVCGVCGHDVVWQKMLGDGIWADEKLDYCPNCGRKVKWNG